MATKVPNTAVIAAGRQIVAEGYTYEQMDCQAAVEEALVRAGVPRSECNLTGSNAHYRRALWRGTPEYCCELLGVKEVPAGMQMYIVLASGEPAKYQGDTMGNADHMGWYLGGGETFHSGSSARGTAISTKFKGKKAVPNGGWNMVALSEWVDCGLTAAQLAKLQNDGNWSDAKDTASAGGEDGDSGTELPANGAQKPDVSTFYKVKKGSLGGAVRRLQTWLQDLGYSLAVDGEFGPATDNAVKYFQEEKGLTVDGIVGQATWQALADARWAAMEAAQG